MTAGKRRDERAVPESARRELRRQLTHPYITNQELGSTAADEEAAPDEDVGSRSKSDPETR